MFIRFTDIPAVVVDVSCDPSMAVCSIFDSSLQNMYVVRCAQFGCQHCMQQHPGASTPAIDVSMARIEAPKPKGTYTPA